MALRLKNTLTNQLEEFHPLDPAGRQVLLYSCGPTVYSFAHIGNFRSFLLADLLRRVLERREYSVRHVMNITDVGHMTQDHVADASGEDKLSRAARELGWNPFEVARHFEEAFRQDATSLRMRNYQGAEADNATLHPRATRYIPEMLQMIQELLEQGFAYTDSQGQVYFELAKFPEYGQLSGKKLDELTAGARVEVREEKRDPRDFALWKTDKKHLMQWDPHTGEGFEAADLKRLKELLPQGVDARVGRGFPGWHIECSAMAASCLDQLIDVHTGGEDNIFPHHECEIAQSCSALHVSTPGKSAKTFSAYWVHGRHLLVNGRKMSKRDGTFYTVRDLLDPEKAGRSELAEQLALAGFKERRVSAPVLRFALMSVSYTQPMNFSMDLLVQAKSQVSRLQSLYERLTELAAEHPTPGPVNPELKAAIARHRNEFDAALDNNLDLGMAMAAAGRFAGSVNQLQLTKSDATAALEFLNELDTILDVLSREVRAGVITKRELQRWEAAEQFPALVATLTSWQGDSERGLLFKALAAGELPGEPALNAIQQLDQELTEVLLGARHAAKKRKQYACADAIRSRLQALNATIEDRPDGVRWRLGSTDSSPTE